MIIHIRDDEFNVLEVLSQTLMPEGYCLLKTGEYSEKKNGIAHVETVEHIFPVLYHAVFRIGEPGDEKSDTEIVELFGIIDEYRSTDWVETTDSKVRVFNHDLYVGQCRKLGVRPLSFLQYYLALQREENVFNITRIPKFEPMNDPEWLILEREKAKNQPTE